MKTVVYQSYRTTAVAPWITRALETVRRWAEARGFAYEFFDDALFDTVPAWFRERVGGHKVIMSDPARAPPGETPPPAPRPRHLGGRRRGGVRP